MTPENKVTRLPDYYAKGKTSNNWKIMELQRQGMEILNKEIELVQNASNINDAEGEGLDVWGDMYEVKRNGLLDEEYRIQILIQMARDMIQPDFTAWYSTILETFHRSADEIMVSKTGPFECRFDKFPLAAVQEIGLDINTATQLIEAILPLTCELLEIIYDGGVPKDIVIRVGSVLGSGSSGWINNDINSQEEIYVNMHTLVAATGEIYEDCEGNFGRDDSVQTNAQQRTAATAIGSGMTCMLQDIVIKTETRTAEPARAAAVISNATTYGLGV